MHAQGRGACQASSNTPPKQSTDDDAKGWTSSTARQGGVTAQMEAGWQIPHGPGGTRGHLVTTHELHPALRRPWVRQRASPHFVTTAALLSSVLVCQPHTCAPPRHTAAKRSCCTRQGTNSSPFRPSPPLPMPPVASTSLPGGSRCVYGMAGGGAPPLEPQSKCCHQQLLHNTCQASAKKRCWEWKCM